MNSEIKPPFTPSGNFRLSKPEPNRAAPIRSCEDSIQLRSRMFYEPRRVTSTNFPQQKTHSSAGQHRTGQRLRCIVQRRPLARQVPLRP